jgi:hypothetical protein
VNLFRVTAESDKECPPVDEAMDFSKFFFGHVENILGESVLLDKLRLLVRPVKPLCQLILMITTCAIMTLYTSIYIMHHQDGDPENFSIIIFALLPGCEDNISLSDILGPLLKNGERDVNFSLLSYAFNLPPSYRTRIAHCLSHTLSEYEFHISTADSKEHKLVRNELLRKRTARKPEEGVNGVETGAGGGESTAMGGNKSGVTDSTDYIARPEAFAKPFGNERHMPLSLRHCQLSRDQEYSVRDDSKDYFST